MYISWVIKKKHKCKCRIQENRQITTEKRSLSTGRLTDRHALSIQRHGPIVITICPVQISLYGDVFQCPYHHEWQLVILLCDLQCTEHAGQTRDCGLGQVGLIVSSGHYADLLSLNICCLLDFLCWNNQ